MKTLICLLVCLNKVNIIKFLKVDDVHVYVHVYTMDKLAQCACTLCWQINPNPPVSPRERLYLVVCAGNHTKTSLNTVDTLLVFCCDECQNSPASPFISCDPIGLDDHATWLMEGAWGEPLWWGKKCRWCLKLIIAWWVGFLVGIRHLKRPLSEWGKKMWTVVWY